MSNRTVIVLGLGLVAACQKPAHCNSAGDGCCAGDVCNNGLMCLQGSCVTPGTPCAHTSDCTPGWTCAGPDGNGIHSCVCTPSVELCNGKDDDCDGIVDNGMVDAECQSILGGGAACIDGACSCQGTMCDGYCRNTDIDVLNCGSCGTTCSDTDGGAAACVGGVCGSESQFEAGDGPLGIADDADNIYFYTSGALRKQPLDGSAQSTLWVIGGDKPNDYAAYEGFSSEKIAIEGNTIIFSVDTWIQTFDLDGGTATTTFGNTGGQFASDSEHLYSAFEYADGLDAIVEEDFDGGTPRTLGSEVGMIQAVDSSSVYMTEISGEMTDAGPVSRLMWVSRFIPFYVELFEQPGWNDFEKIAVDDDFVYFTADDGQLVPPSGGVFAGNYDPPASDGGEEALLLWLYSATSHSRIMRVAKTGGPPTVLFDAGARALLFCELALDGTNLYWTMVDSSGGGLFRMPKDGSAPPVQLYSAPGLSVTDFAVGPVGVDIVGGGTGQDGPLTLTHLTPK